MTRSIDDLTEKEIFDWLDEKYGDTQKFRVEQYKKDYLEDRDQFFSDFGWSNSSYDLPWLVCPICTFVEIPESDIKLYLSKMTGVTESEVFVEVKKVNKRRKKLYDCEYIDYSIKKLPTETTLKELKTKLKEEFENYENFYKFISE